MANVQLNVAPGSLSGVLVPGDGVTFTATSESGDWPATTRLRVLNSASVETVFTPTIATTLATWALTVAEVTALLGTKATGSLSARITHGTGDALRPVKAGRLSIVSKWDGVRSAQSLGTVTLGPEGPTAVSTDPGNVASLGTDGLIFVSPTAGSAHVIQDEGVALTNRAALNFVGTGVTVTDDAGNGATLVTITGDQALPTWSTIAGKPGVVAEGATAADARTAIGAGTSSFSGAYADLSGKPTLGTAAAAATTDFATAAQGSTADSAVQPGDLGDSASLDVGTTAGTVAAGDHNHTGVYLTAETLAASIVDAKGDLIVGSAADTVARLAVGTNGHVLVADSGESGGLKYVYVHSLPQTINAQTGTAYTLQASDAGKLVTCTNAAAITVTLPKDSDATIPIGSRIDFAVLGAGMVTFAAGTGATANGTPSLVSRAQYSGATCYKRAANTWLVVGDLA